MCFLRAQPAITINLDKKKIDSGEDDFNGRGELSWTAQVIRDHDIHKSETEYIVEDFCSKDCIVFESTNDQDEADRILDLLHKGERSSLRSGTNMQKCTLFSPTELPPTVDRRAFLAGISTRQCQKQSIAKVGLCLRPLEPNSGLVGRPKSTVSHLIVATVAVIPSLRKKLLGN